MCHDTNFTPNVFAFLKFGIVVWLIVTGFKGWCPDTNFESKNFGNVREVDVK